MGKMTKGSRWVWECIELWPAMGLARLESHGQIRDVNLDADGKPLDPAWRELVPEPCEDVDVSDCEDDAFSRPGEIVPVVRTVSTVEIEPEELAAFPPQREDLTYQNVLTARVYPTAYAQHRAEHTATPDPSCPFCKGRA